MTPIRVLMIGPYPRSPDRINGGVAAAVMYLSEALAAQEEIELIGARIARSGDVSRDDRALGWPVLDVPLGRLSLSTFYRRQKQRLRELIRRYDPHIVHGQGADLAGLLAVSCGRPSVVTVHGLLAECARYQTDLVSRLRASLAASATERPVIHRARHLIAISPYVAQYYAREIRGNVHHIPNAVAPGFFHIARRPERGRLVYAGRIANGKGLVELLHAAARNRSAVSKLVLAGATPEPSYERRLLGMVKSLALDDRVEFAGLLTERQIFDEFSRAELLVLPSHQETAPMVVQQAMAAGLAVIATTVGGIPHQIQHNVTGLLFEAGDVDTLAGLIGRVGADAMLSRRLGDSAKAVAASRYQADAVAQATLSVYRTVLGVEAVRAS